MPLEKSGVILFQPSRNSLKYNKAIEHGIDAMVDKGNPEPSGYGGGKYRTDRAKSVGKITMAMQVKMVDTNNRLVYIHYS